MSMKLKRISVNTRELIISDDKGWMRRVLISYSTPVAFMLRDGLYGETEKKWSSSTSRQIQKWRASLDYPECQTFSQEFINNLLKGTELYEEIGNWKYTNNQTYLVADFNKRYK